MEGRVIGFIGLGIMGSRMCKNIIKNGEKVVVWNRTPDKAKPLEEMGAEKAETPREIGEKANIVITMLADPPAIKSVALGEEGFLHTMKQSSIWINTSTVDPKFTKKMASEAQKKGIRFVDAPVLGSKGAAENAKLIFLVGAKEGDLREVEPILKYMGSKIIHVGDVGSGSAMKMVVNSMLAISMISFAEAITLGEALGIERNFLLDTLAELPVSAPFLRHKKEKIKNMDFEEEFPLELMVKDLYLASKMGYETNTPLPTTNVAKEIYALAKANGMGRMDFSAIYNFLSEIRKYM